MDLSSAPRPRTRRQTIFSATAQTSVTPIILVRRSGEIIQRVSGQTREVLLIGIAAVSKSPAVRIAGGDDLAAPQPVFNNVFGVMVWAGQYAAIDFIRCPPSGVIEESVGVGYLTFQCPGTQT